MMVRNLYLIVILLVALCAQSSLAQNTKLVLTEDQKAEIGLLSGVSSQPVVYGTSTDNLPRKVKVHGVIKEVTFVPFACGVFCWSGTAKIKLLKKVNGYKPEYIYVTVLCFMGKEEDFLNKTVEVKVSKLEKGKMTGCDGVVNSIDSQGVAFYRLDKNQSLK